MNMTPSFTLSDVTHGCPSDAKHGSDCSLWNSLREQPKYLSDRILSEPRPSVAATRCAIASPALNHPSHVVASGSGGEMLGVTAGRVVAAMQYMHPRRDVALEQLVCESMGSDAHVVDRGYTIAEVLPRADPLPATGIRNDGNTGHEVVLCPDARTVFAPVVFRTDAPGVLHA